jgi:hypothetical protein
MSIELHTWDTPNGRKISVSLEDMGLTYTVHPVNIFKGEQFDPAFLKISPRLPQGLLTTRFADLGGAPRRRWQVGNSNAISSVERRVR